jgi:hypothetical protein
MTSLGKWSEPGVPHRGWTCTGVTDLEEPAATCEMCETAAIRYVHHMEHADYPGGLGVGCTGRQRPLRGSGTCSHSWLETRDWAIDCRPGVIVIANRWWYRRHQRARDIVLRDEAAFRRWLDRYLSKHPTPHRQDGGRSTQ